jgi:hypothetical protein
MKIKHIYMKFKTKTLRLHSYIGYCRCEAASFSETLIGESCSVKPAATTDLAPT